MKHWISKKWFSILTLSVFVFSSAGLVDVLYAKANDKPGTQQQNTISGWGDNSDELPGLTSTVGGQVNSPPKLN